MTNVSAFRHTNVKSHIELSINLYCFKKTIDYFKREQE